MLKFDDPVFIAQLHKLNDELQAEILKALDNKRYGDLARFTGIGQGLILAINIARHESVRVPRVSDLPFLGAVIATLYDDEARAE